MDFHILAEKITSIMCILID